MHKESSRTVETTENGDVVENGAHASYGGIPLPTFLLNLIFVFCEPEASAPAPLGYRL